MIFDKIKETVGQERFEKAVQVLAGTADKLTGIEDESPEFIHDIPYIVAKAGISILEQEELWLKLIYLLPCYATWMYTFSFYKHDLSMEQKPSLLIEIARILDDSPDTIASAAQYALWADFFEDPETVELSWWSIIKNLKTSQGKLRLLDVSGPVPYELKADFYEVLAKNPDCHNQLVDALYSCLKDVFGKADIDKMRALMAKLSNSKLTKQYKAVMEAIS